MHKLQSLILHICNTRAHMLHARLTLFVFTLKTYFGTSVRTFFHFFVVEFPETIMLVHCFPLTQTGHISRTLESEIFMCASLVAVFFFASRGFFIDVQPSAKRFIFEPEKSKSEKRKYTSSTLRTSVEFAQHWTEYASDLATDPTRSNSGTGKHDQWNRT